MRMYQKEEFGYPSAIANEYISAIISTVSLSNILRSLINFAKFVNKIKIFVNLMTLFVVYERIIILKILNSLKKLGF